MLDGLIPGMRIEPNTDSPSVRTRNNVRIRGDGSLNASSEPMWIVDGVPVYTGTGNEYYRRNEHEYKSALFFESGRYRILLRF